MSKYQVFFVSTPGIGNLVPTVEFAQRLIHHDPRISSTIFIISLSQRPIVNSYIQSRASTYSGVNFIHLPPVDTPSPDQYQSSLGYLSLLIQKHKLHVKHEIDKLQQAESDSARVCGLLVDMFSTSMIDVANELNIPCYLYYASPVSFLGFMLHLPVIDTQLATEFIDSDNEMIVPKDAATELIIPGFANPLPPKVLPSSVLKRKKDGYSWFLYHARRYVETKGVVVNTYRELEQYAINSVAATTKVPEVFPVGPVLDLAGPIEWHPDRDQQHNIMKWLDDQPRSSVVFLCFGSMGSLGRSQLREIAFGLERSGFRFLWSIREPPKGSLDLPSDYANAEEILPEGFLDRTAEIGLICGWVPQVTILANEAIGGFVSHCGWNSILESLWYGVPIATWPIYAEQQMNAFQLVKELGLAVEIRVDFRNESGDLVLAEEVERGIKRLMDVDDEVRRKVKEMSKKSKMAVMENGSSHASLKSLIEKLTAEI
ncbi:hypothetical protein GH714_027993 [Hevea brasiliensis]|uniref:Glycosyltransferase n=1 Tax=Hevea brasiliensis TaxID=3981 RepID=A0A6A6KD07_HEVBR|nr:hypothetical protein GH714_027993 [Hevea brasiliensis]